MTVSNAQRKRKEEELAGIIALPTLLLKTHGRLVPPSLRKRADGDGSEAQRGTLPLGTVNGSLAPCEM